MSALGKRLNMPNLGKVGLAGAKFTLRGSYVIENQEAVLAEQKTSTGLSLKAIVEAEIEVAGLKLLASMITKDAPDFAIKLFEGTLPLSEPFEAPKPYSVSYMVNDKPFVDLQPGGTTICNRTTR